MKRWMWAVLFAFVVCGPLRRSRNRRRGRRSRSNWPSRISSSGRRTSRTCAGASSFSCSGTARERTRAGARRTTPRVLAPGREGQPPAKARTAPVVPLDGLRAGQVAPDVLVVPVACCGKVPGPIQPAISKQIAKGSPDMVVWLDFADTMKGMFGLTPGETNVVVVDAKGVARLKLNGALDQPTMDNLIKTVQGLRAEAAK